MKLSSFGMQAALLSAVISLLPSEILAYAKGNSHQKPEPITVLPLSMDTREYALAVNGKVLDNAIGPVKSTLQVRVLQISPKRIMVEFVNSGDKALQLSLFQVMADGRYTPSATCPIKPGQTSIEVWNEAFDALGFGEVVLPDAEALKQPCKIE